MSFNDILRFAFALIFGVIAHVHQLWEIYKKINFTYKVTYSKAYIS